MGIWIWVCPFLDRQSNGYYPCTLPVDSFHPGCLLDCACITLSDHSINSSTVLTSPACHRRSQSNPSLSDQPHWGILFLEEEKPVLFRTWYFGIPLWVHLSFNKCSLQTSILLLYTFFNPLLGCLVWDRNNCAFSRFRLAFLFKGCCFHSTRQQSVSLEDLGKEGSVSGATAWLRYCSSAFYWSKCLFFLFLSQLLL